MRLYFIVSVFLLAWGVSLGASISHAQEFIGTRVEILQPAQVKLLDAPPVFPELAQANVEGTVTVQVVVSNKGKVIQAEVLAGPKELYAAALASAKGFKFEPFSGGPITQNVEVSYGFPKECPASQATGGEIETNSSLFDKDGKRIAVADYPDDTLPAYPLRLRKEGVTGSMVLWITIDTGGRVKHIEVKKSLAPELDKAAMDRISSWRFRFVGSDPNPSMEDLELTVNFRLLCTPF
jgi:TonB family protein